MSSRYVLHRHLSRRVVSPPVLKSAQASVRRLAAPELAQRLALTT
jgi:hypothetical protein